MSVNRLEVRNLGPLKHAVLPGAPVTLLLGPNEQGKTMLLRALWILRHGTIPGLDVKDNADLVHAGAEAGWSIEADIDGLVLKASRSQRPLAETFEKVLGDPRVFRALVDVERFLEMTPQERRELAADLVASDTSTLADLLAQEECDPKVVDQVRAGNMKRAFALAEENRRAADRLLDQLKVRAETPLEDPELETKSGKRRVSTLPLEVVVQGIERLKARRDDAVTAVAKRSHHESAIADGKRAADELKGFPESERWTSADEGELAKIQKDLDETRGKVTTAALTRDQRYKDAEALAKLLKDPAGACPTCRTKLEGAVRKAVQEAIEKLNGDGLKAANENRDLAGTLKGKEERRKELIEKRAAHDKTATLRARLQERVDQAAKLEVPPEPEESPEALRLEIERLEKMRDARKAYDTAAELRQKAKDAIQERQARRDQLVRWEGMVKPGQVAGEAEVLQELNAYITEAAKPLFAGEEAPVLVTPGWEVLVHHRRLALASTSARLRAGFACAVALSRLSKLGLLFLDQLEAIDDTNRRGVMGVLKKAVDDGWLKNAWLAAVKQDPKPSAMVPWLAWVEVKGGTATRLM